MLHCKEKKEMLATFVVPNPSISLILDYLRGTRLDTRELVLLKNTIFSFKDHSINQQFRHLLENHFFNFSYLLGKLVDGKDCRRIITEEFMDRILQLQNAEELTIQLK